MIQFIQVFR